MRIDTQTAYNLNEYFACINSIAQKVKSDNIHPPVLWFRGVGDVSHYLIPSIFRTNTRVERDVNNKGDYSQLHYAEDIRTQHYIAKNFHFFNTEPSSRVEWLEVMQHHGVKTRVLDWSESSLHSLLFAIEPFLKGNSPMQQDRKNCVPCVWVLEPAELNKRIFGYIKANCKKNEIKDLFDELGYTAAERRMITEIIERFSNFDIYGETAETTHIDYILNLSVINDEISRDRTRISRLLLEGDIVNPYYYILSRIYSDGHILEKRELPPLAVVHPYHSERIKAQHGVFTVFPFYKEDKRDAVLRKWKINPDAMNENKIAAGVLHQIKILNPQQMAYELMQNGMNDSWLYPEMPVVSSEIENHAIHS